MAQWIALSTTDHRDASLLPRDGYRFTEHRRTVPILMAELSKVIPNYLLGFIAQDEGYVLVALLGTAKNAYLAPDGRWMAPYVPAGLRSYPFALANAEDGNRVLAIDADRLGDDGEPLFNGEELSETVQSTLDFLQNCEKNRAITEQATAKLAEYGLITPWKLDVADSAKIGDRVNIEGIYHLDEAKLNQLDGEALAELKGAPLALAYAQLFAMEQHKALDERLEFHAKQAGQNGQVPKSFDSVFGEDDDKLSFDFN